MFKFMHWTLLIGATVLATGCDESTDDEATTDGGGKTDVDRDAGGQMMAIEAAVGGDAPWKQDGGTWPVAVDAAASDSASTDCAASCAAVAVPNCKYPLLDSCIFACDVHKIQARGHCEDEVTKYYSCMKTASFRCVDSSPRTDDCSSQYGTIDRCFEVHPLTCEAPAGGSLCETCVAARCCKEKTIRENLPDAASSDSEYSGCKEHECKRECQD